MLRVRFKFVAIILVLSITIFITTSIGAQVFTFGNRYGTEEWPECIAVGNYDDDAFIDIAISHRDTGLILIYINDGNGSFAQSYSLEVYKGMGVKSADFDDNGIDDLLLFDENQLIEDLWGITVQLNNGDGTFAQIFIDTIGFTMCTGYFDGNNDLDIAVYHGSDSIGIWVYWGAGDGSFAGPVMIQPLLSEMWLDAADLDDDGDDDIIYASPSKTYSLINDGTGQFGEPIITDGAMNSMVLADLNGDAYPDLVGKGIFACTGVPHYMLGNGDGTFGAETRAWLTAGVLLKSYVMSADFNSDGYGDIAYYSYDMDSVAIGFNDGLQGFDNIEYIIEVNTGGTYLEAGDFENDGDLDLAITGLDDTLSIVLSVAAQHFRRILVPDDFPSVQDAIDYAWNFDTIIVDPGIYYENLDFGGKNIVLLSSDYAEGTKKFNFITGFEKSASTIIDGGDLGSVIIFQNGEDERSIVAGFTIQNGSSDWGGGGIFCDNPTAPTIIHNIIKDNYADFLGGGVYIAGGLASLKNNLIVRNNSNGVGGGIYIIGGEEISNNTIYDNNAVNGGGGMFFNSGTPVNCNNIFWGNSSTNNEEEIRYLSDPPAISYCIVQGGWPGDGNLDEDPMFVDPVNDDFNLMEGSPCIDAGDPNMPNDPDGTPSDIGAIYYQNPLDVNDENGVTLPYRFELSQNYPNPFNPVTSIEYNIPTRSHITIEVYNILGQKIRTLVDENKSAGEYNTIWDGGDSNERKVSTGIYFYRFQAGDYVETKKMILLK